MTSTRSLSPTSAKPWATAPAGVRLLSTQATRWNPVDDAPPLWSNRARWTDICRFRPTSVPERLDVRGVSMTYRQNDEVYTADVRDLDVHEVLAADPMDVPEWGRWTASRPSIYAPRSMPGRQVQSISMFERQTIVALDWSGTSEVVSQPLLMEWEDSKGDVKSHLPDFLAVVDGEVHLINCRPERRMDEALLANSMVCAGVARALGWRYHLIVGYRNPIYTNVDNLLAAHGVDPLAYGPLLIEALREGPRTFGDLITGFEAQAVARATLRGLIADRRLVIDLNQRLTDDTEVHLP